MKRTPDTIATVLLLVGLAIACARLSVGCSQLTPADKAQVAKDQIELSVCAGEAHMSKLADAGAAASWAAFDGCMTRYGFYDGGPDAR